MPNPVHPLAALATVAALAAAPAHAVNLVTNGSFETPQTVYADYGTGSTTLTGWTAVLSGVEHFAPAAYDPVLGAAADGTMAVDLANYVYSAGGIEQTVATTAGQSYVLSFMAGNTAYAGRTGDGLIRVTIDGNTTDVATPTVTGNAIVWEARSVAFTATGASTTIRLWNEQDANTHFALVDAVSAAPVPEPETWALMASGLFGVLWLARRRRGA